jgi:hypothetical protein
MAERNDEAQVDTEAGSRGIVGAHPIESGAGYREDRIVSSEFSVGSSDLEAYHCNTIPRSLGVTAARGTRRFAIFVPTQPIAAQIAVPYDPKF